LAGKGAIVQIVLALLISMQLVARLHFPLALQGEPTPDLPTYEGWLREAYFAAQRNDRLGLESIAPRIVGATSVRLPDGSVAPADNSWLSPAIERPDADLAPVAARLGALLDALAQPQSSADPAALERLRELLANPPFAPEPPRELNWFQRLLAFLSDVLERFFGAVEQPVGSALPAIGWVLLFVGALAVVALLVYAVLSLRRGVVREAALPGDPEASLTSADALRQASDTARGGDYRAAVRYLYLASLLWLDERNLLRYDRALTNREYLQQVRPNADLYARLQPVIETFDRVWYGHAPVDAATFEAYRRQIDELRRAT
jgi:hypothetical protein